MLTSDAYGRAAAVMKFRTLHDDSTHFGWDNSLEPALRVHPGEALEFHAQDASGGQITRGSTSADVANLDASRANPVLGPIYVEGAEPGDAIEIEFLDFALGAWGWTAIIPGFGLLQKDFPKPFLHTSAYDEASVEFTSEVRIPTRPFAGTVGLAPGEPGPHSIIPPRRVGGNMDCRDLVRGAKLLLPVEVSGALLSLGDTHAAQGDGEVCGTAVETALTVRLRLGLVKQAPLRFPRCLLPPAPRLVGASYATHGIGPDLMLACQDAIREMIDYLTSEYGLSPELGYCLCSVAVNLRISEVVDAPNWVVSAQLPLDIFE